jgi:hypothetical protein
VCTVASESSAGSGVGQPMQSLGDWYRGIPFFRMLRTAWRPPPGGVPYGFSISNSRTASGLSPRHFPPGRFKSSLSSSSVCPPASPLATLHLLPCAVALHERSPSAFPLPHLRFHLPCMSTASLHSCNHFS